MGTFHTKCRIENTVERSRSAIVSKMLVESGREYTWIPATTLERIGVEQEKKGITFVMANGQQVTRSVGSAIIRVDGYFTIDEVVIRRKGRPIAARCEDAGGTELAGGFPGEEAGCGRTDTRGLTRSRPACRRIGGGELWALSRVGVGGYG